MAKRFQPFKEFGRSTKKPKLDVSINKVRPLGPSQSWPSHIRSNAVEVICVDSPMRSSQNNNNLWDDDDDDVILLATQVAESQVANKSLAATNITDSDITFSEFAPHVHATTSTQRVTTRACVAVKTTVSAPPTTSGKNGLSDLFPDDEDFADLLDAATSEKNAPCTKRAQKNEENEIVFKKPKSAPPMTSDKNCLYALFPNDEDFAELLDPATSEKSRAQKNEGVFKKPTQSDIESYGISGKTLPIASSVQVKDGQSATARRQVATERQVKLLMERLDALKAENTKLAKDLSESKGKIESKDGESSLLRDELRHMKQQLQTLKMEKIMSAEAAKTECKTKISELTKRVEAKESELKLRNVEYSVLKMRHADETQRLEMSIRNANVVGDASVDEGVEKAQSSDSARLLYRLRGLFLTTASGRASKPRLTELHANAYERTQEHGAAKRQHTPFQQELTNAQTLLAQLQLQQQKRSWTAAEAEAFSAGAIASACNALPEFWTYVHGLEFPKHCNVHPYHDYDLRNDDYTSHSRNLHSALELHADECGISLRRYVAALSVMCAQAPSFGKLLLAEQHGEYALLQVACHAISKLGYSSEICAHFGTLEAFATLLRVLLRQVCADSEDHIELLVGGLLKQLIFVRPSAWIFQELSYCVLELTRLPAALALLCVNSNESTFYSDRMRSLYRFSNESCVLQVYAGLLEIAFPLNGVLSEAHLRLLAVICENHVRFAHFCFMKPPDFIHKLLPSYDDDDEDDEADDQQVNATGEQSNKELAGAAANSIGSATAANELVTMANSNSTMRDVSVQPKKSTSMDDRARCECYTKLCLSVVTLLFQLLRQWQCTGRTIETPRVAEVSQTSVQLLHTIFCDNYSTHLFRYAEETTKHYLWLICEWWSVNADCLKFNNVQKNFLNKLRAFHIMPKQLNEEGNAENVISDLKDWHSLTNDNARSSGVSASANLPIAVEKLNIMRSVGDESKFFEGLKGYAFNFE